MTGCVLVVMGERKILVVHPQRNGGQWGVGKDVQCIHKYSISAYSAPGKSLTPILPPLPEARYTILALWRHWFYSLPLI